MSLGSGLRISIKDGPLATVRTLVSFRDEALAGKILETLLASVLPTDVATIAVKHSASALAASLHTEIYSVSDDISAR